MSETTLVPKGLQRCYTYPKSFQKRPLLRRICIAIAGTWRRTSHQCNFSRDTADNLATLGYRVTARTEEYKVAQVGLDEMADNPFDGAVNHARAEDDMLSAGAGSKSGASVFWCVLAASTTFNVGCMATSGPDDTAPIENGSARAPMPDAVLNRVYRENRGLIPGLSEDGKVLTQGARIEPLVLEARRFYDTLQYPFAEEVRVDYANPFTGEPRDTAKTAPLTLTRWKEIFGFPPREPGEDLPTYRARLGIVIYYNHNELGLGRELGCARFIDAYGPEGEPIMGEACYVTNYGVAFRDLNNSLAAAMSGNSPKNTVCITYRPSLPEDYQVQFYVYGSEGVRQDWAQIDTHGPRPVPHVCMNCHGGIYDEERHMAKFARFLPTDPNTVTFAHGDGVPQEYTREGQEEHIRKINVAALRSPLTPIQRDAFEGLYGGRVQEEGRRTATDYAPAGWRERSEDVDLWNKVVKPYCGTCHMAEQKAANGTQQWFYDAFESKAAFVQAGLVAYVCNSFQMPNAQPTLHEFWDDTREPVMIGDKGYASAADAFLAAYGVDRQSCGGYETMSDCRRGADPDLICGNRFSGTACDLNTGRCVPALADEAPSSPMLPTGVCQVNGPRGCYPGQECRPTEQSLVDGFDGACFTCGREGFPVCAVSTVRCQDDLVALAGMCVRQ